MHSHWSPQFNLYTSHHRLWITTLSKPSKNSSQSALSPRSGGGFNSAQLWPSTPPSYEGAGSLQPLWYNAHSAALSYTGLLGGARPPVQKSMSPSTVSVPIGAGALGGVRDASAVRSIRLSLSLGSSCFPTIAAF
jgi:hypothetical protein